MNFTQWGLVKDGFIAILLARDLLYPAPPGSKDKKRLESWILRLFLRSRPIN